MIQPIAHLSAIPLHQANDLLVQWKHRMGPLLRGKSGALHVHALLAHGSPVAIATTSSLIAPCVGGGLGHLTRSNTVELSRLCASVSWANRVMLRLWRELVFPATGMQYAISYQDADMHTGNTYRFDGWARVGFSHSGKDTRSGRPGRNKWIWVWQHGAALQRSKAA